MSQLPYINETHKQEHEKEANAKRSLMIGYDSDTLSYNKLKVNSDGGASGAMGAQTQPFDLDLHDVPFSIGLTLVISGANANVFLAYE